MTYKKSYFKTSIYLVICFLFFGMNPSACMDEKGNDIPHGEKKERLSFSSSGESPTSLKRSEAKRKKRFSLSMRRSSSTNPKEERKKGGGSSDSENLDKPPESSDSKSVSVSFTNGIDELSIEELTNEDRLSAIISELEQKYPKPIIGFLNQLTNQDFLQNEKKMELSIPEFEKLNGSIASSDSALITQPGVEGGQNNINWQELEISDVVEKLSLMDLRLLQGVSYDDICRYVKNQKDCSESILILGNQFTRTANLIAFQIVAAKTELERRALISKFLLIGRFLFERHNFHGTMQIVMAFMTPAVDRLLSTKETSNGIWKTISGVAEFKDNFRVYRKLLSEFQDETTCLPVFSIILSDLLHDYEEFESAACVKHTQTMANKLEGIAKTLMAFSKCQTLPCPILEMGGNDPVLKLFREFKIVDSEVLEVYSSLRTKLNLPSKPEKPTELQDWTPCYFASSLKYHGCENQIEAIFDRGIYNGMDIIKYMGNINQRKKLTELGMNENMISTIISANFGNF